jgi:GNAT superfamily N-acetyltransferase
MPDFLGDFTPAALTDAVVANFAAFFGYLGRAPQAVAHEDAETAWCISGIPIAEYNAVTRFRLPDGTGPATVRARVRHILAVFAQRRLGMLWWVGPATRPANLGDYLRDAGLEFLGSGPGMAADLTALNGSGTPPASLHIERVGDEAALWQWVQVAGTSYGEPEAILQSRFAVHAALGLDGDRPLQRYLALLDGEPVAIAALLLAAGVAGIYEVATIPAARRKGIGGAVTLEALRQASARGYRVGVLEASPMGFPVYTRLGFQQTCSFDIYSFMPPPDQTP